MAAQIHTIHPAGDVWDLSTAKIAAASAALTVIASHIESMCLFILSARKPSAGRASIDEHIMALQTEICIAARDAGFNEPFGGSWFLAGTWSAPAGEAGDEKGLAPDERFDADRAAGQDAGLVNVQGLQRLYAAAHSAETGILSFRTDGASESDLDVIIQMLAEGLASVSTAQNVLGTLAEFLEGRNHREFVFGLGLRSLVDADMDEQSTRIVALDIQQKLSVQSLSIANDNAAVILKLLG